MASNRLLKEMFRHYHSTMVNLNAEQVATAVAVVACTDFPSLLPPPVASTFKQMQDEISRARAYVVLRREMESDRKVESAIPQLRRMLPKDKRFRSHGKALVFGLWNHMAHERALSRVLNRDPKFRRRSIADHDSNYAKGKFYTRGLLAQGLIAACAHFESFLSVTTRLVLEANPDLLASFKPDGQLSRSTVLSLGSWERFVNHLVDQSVRDVGRGSMVDQIAVLRAKFKVRFPFPSGAAEFINDAEARRNTFVHAGGFVDKAYLKRVPGTRLRPGKPIPIDLRYLVRARYGMMKLVDLIYESGYQRLGGRKPPSEGIPHELAPSASESGGFYLEIRTSRRDLRI
jgi:hypothetical protein